MAASRKRRCRGGSALEIALLFPWLMLLFVGAFDWGFYAHALISTEGAAREAALYTSTNLGTAAVTPLNTIKACGYVLEELRIASNVPSTLTTCTTDPVTLTYGTVTGADGAQASQVTVRYQTVSLIPIPGLLPGQTSISRSVQMRLRG